MQSLSAEVVFASESFSWMFFIWDGVVTGELASCISCDEYPAMLRSDLSLGLGVLGVPAALGVPSREELLYIDF